MAYHHQPMPASPLETDVRDTTYTKVFVGGLAWETQRDSLQRFFEQFGDILEAVVISDKNTGRSKGYGFVTFLDPEAARRACENPSPVIDGRRANCNLAALGRLQLPHSFGRTRPVVPLSFTGRVQPPRISFIGNPGYQQTTSYGYQTGYIYPPHGYTTYPPEYVYSQGAYSPYLSQHYQVYSVPGAASTGLYPYGLSGHPPRNHAYASIPNYMVPGQHIVQFGGQNLNGASAVQAPYPAGGAAVPGQAQIIVTAHCPQFTNGSDLTAG